MILQVKNEEIVSFFECGLNFTGNSIRLLDNIRTNLVKLSVVFVTLKFIQAIQTTNKFLILTKPKI